MNPGDIIAVQKKKRRYPAKILEINITRAYVCMWSEQVKDWSQQNIKFEALVPASDGERARFEELAARVPVPPPRKQWWKSLQPGRKKIRNKAPKAEPDPQRPAVDRVYLSQIAAYRLVGLEHKTLNGKYQPVRVVRQLSKTIWYVQIFLRGRWTILTVPDTALAEPTAQERDMFVEMEHAQYPLSDSRYCCEAMRRLIAGENFWSTNSVPDDEDLAA